jgi:hypothetical protein
MSVIPEWRMCKDMFIITHVNGVYDLQFNKQKTHTFILMNIQFWGNKIQLMNIYTVGVHIFADALFEYCNDATVEQIKQKVQIP